MVKKFLTAILAAGALLTATEMGSSSLGKKYLENDLRTLREWKIHENNQRERKIEDFMTAYPSFSRQETENIMYYNYLLPVDHFELAKDGAYTGSTVEMAITYLTDESIWKRFFWKSYDQLPHPIDKYALDRIFVKYSDAADMGFHIHKSVFGEVPEPVLVVNMLKKVQYWTKYWHPNASPERLEEITDRSIAILLQESFATHQAQGKDHGPFQISPETMHRIKHHPEFRKYSKADFENWDVSVKAGTFWLSECLKDAKGDLDLATGAYNAGIYDAQRNTRKARAYREAVNDRQARYVFSTESPTWKYILEKSGVKTSLDRKFDQALQEASP